MLISNKVKRKTSTCPVCQGRNIGTFPVFQTIDYARTFVTLRGTDPIKNVTPSKNSVKTNEIIRCLDCGCVLALGNRLNPYINFTDSLFRDKLPKSKELNTLTELRELSTFPSYATHKLDTSDSSFSWHKPRCTHLETLHSDLNALFCQQCGQLTFLGKLYDKGLLTNK
jgi:hypothetical protein